MPACTWFWWLHIYLSTFNSNLIRAPHAFVCPIEAVQPLIEDFRAYPTSLTFHTLDCFLRAARKCVQSFSNTIPVCTKCTIKRMHAGKRNNENVRRLLDVPENVCVWTENTKTVYKKETAKKLDQNADCCECIVHHVEGMQRQLQLESNVAKRWNGKTNFVCLWNEVEEKKATIRRASDSKAKSRRPKPKQKIGAKSRQLLVSHLSTDTSTREHVPLVHLDGIALCAASFTQKCT